ncbi:hypothetical protein BGZ61DRAFT_516837 [Ilyonectria robusta]|uniref:uncharacterized protein n=1 Tax=Ilyonectria robusta TaxID=1079257 RepID=UPI001E8D6233|nr:uncharacterized protein BGZ61DRAFT_516837 [Ilyonectria robusta]KAH8714694.1 hypothetical protein BGZ61DRAFT_516837 [Ilyonectria robusta]
MSLDSASEHFSSDSDSEEGFGYNEEGPGEEESLFQQASKEVTKGRKFTSERDVADFFDTYHDIVGKESDSGNLLHWIVVAVQLFGVEPENFELLIRRLVMEYPYLLRNPNKESHKPMYKAVQANTPLLVQYMISACKECCKLESQAMQHLDNGLQMVSAEGQTCLHIALREQFDPQVTRLMIENASLETLAIQDNLGKTAMHYAVAFNQCSNMRTELISLFLERDLTQLNALHKMGIPQKPTFLDLLNNSRESVYREHERLSKAFELKRKKDKAIEKSRSGGGDQVGIQVGTVKSSEKPTSKGTKEVSRSQLTPRDGKHSFAKAEGDRGGVSKPGHDVDEGEQKVDEREARRRLKKQQEEAENERRKNKANGTDSIEDDHHPGELDPFSPEVEVDPTAQLALRRTKTSRPSETVPNTSLKRVDSARRDGKMSAPTALKRPSQGTKKSYGPEKSSVSSCRRNSKKILLTLKLHYMRTRNAEKVILFLYGTNMDDIQINFDYDRLPRDMTWKKFLKRFGSNAETGLKFDQVLQYVTFPYVNVQLTGRHADQERQREEEMGMSQLGGEGRKDMKYFFDWLYEKGVRHIIKLSVNDSRDPSGKVHSDEVIQQCLERFVIERLDWQKVDLDPETILHVSSKALEKVVSAKDETKKIELVPNRQLKELTLRWSGSNAVLRAWNEPEGLPRLAHLERISLYEPPPDKTLDNRRWIEKKIGEFEVRLNTNFKKARESEATASSQDTVKITEVRVERKNVDADPDRKGTMEDEPDFKTSLPAKGVNSHKWLDSTTRFAKGMETFWKNTVTDFNETRKIQGTPERIEDDVVIALIDDGVDMFDPSLSSKVLEGKSFDYHHDKVRPVFSSARGHGTVMASMILRVCPMAKIYPIRLKTYETKDGKSQIDRKYAAQAIQAARDKKATIISMSWTLPGPEPSTNPEEDELHKVLHAAVKDKVLMVCCCPDGGKFTKSVYPSGPWPKDFFRIGAAHADGTVFKWTEEDDISFVLPGVDVIKDRVANYGSDGTKKGSTNPVAHFKYETGSSVAAALASGLAAMIIYCVKASILAAKTANHNVTGPILGIGIPDDGAISVAKPEAMRQAFKSLGHETPSRFIQIWDELDKISHVLEQAQAQSWKAEAKQESIKRFVEFGQKLAKST